MNEAGAYKIAAEVLHPFEDRIDVSTGQTLSDRIVCALFKAYKEGQNITSAMHSNGEGRGKSKILDEDLQNCDLPDYGY